VPERHGEDGLCRAGSGQRCAGLVCVVRVLPGRLRSVPELWSLMVILGRGVVGRRLCSGLVAVALILAGVAVVGVVGLVRAPRAAATVPDQFGYVVNDGSSSVTKVDETTGATSGSPIGVGTSPFSIAITPDGSTAIVTNFGSNSVSVINLANKQVTPLNTGFNQPFGVAIAPGGTTAFIVTMVFCASINMGAEFFAYRRLRRAPKLAPLITAVGLSFVFQNIGLKWNGSTPRQWQSVLGQNGFAVHGVKVHYSLFVVLGVTTVLLLGLTYIVRGTRQGKAMRATAQDQDGARLMGINVNSTISFTFALGGAMAGAAAVLYVQTLGTTRYDSGFELGLIAFTAAVLGGIGNLTGAVLGAMLIGVIQGMNDGLAYGLGQRWSQTVVFAILILLMVFKPEGLLGTRTIEKV
jgi:YVTN family beta-propeller protein